MIKEYTVKLLATFLIDIFIAFIFSFSFKFLIFSLICSYLFWTIKYLILEERMINTFLDSQELAFKIKNEEDEE